MNDVLYSTVLVVRILQTRVDWKRNRLWVKAGRSEGQGRGANS